MERYKLGYKESYAMVLADNALRLKLSDYELDVNNKVHESLGLTQAEMQKKYGTNLLNWPESLEFDIALKEHYDKYSRIHNRVISNFELFSDNPDLEVMLDED